MSANFTNPQSVEAAPTYQSSQVLLDGHEFYLVTVSGEVTLAYDVTSGVWYVWRHGTGGPWRVRSHLYWRKQPFLVAYGPDALCRVVTGRKQDHDNSEIRTVYTAFLPAEARETYAVAALFVNTSREGDGHDVNLHTSGDFAKTWDVFFQQPYRTDHVMKWDFVGRSSAPGTLYRFTDTAGPYRIDYVKACQEE